jgi:hypothetical protein
MKKVFYLAAPYYHKNYAKMAERVTIVSKTCIELLKLGIYCFSPLTQNHTLRKIGKLESGWNVWGKYDEALLSHCDGIIVLKLDGWETSKGIAAEIKIAKKLNLKIYYFEPFIYSKLIKDINEEKSFMQGVFNKLRKYSKDIRYKKEGNEYTFAILNYQIYNDFDFIDLTWEIQNKAIKKNIKLSFYLESRTNNGKR